MAYTLLSKLLLFSADSVRMADKCPSAYRLPNFVMIQNFLCVWFYHEITQAARRVHNKIMRMKIFTKKDKAKPQQWECKGWNLVAVRLVKVQWTKLSVQQNRGQRAMAAVKAVMCTMHIALNTLITVWLYVHKMSEHIVVYCSKQLELMTKDLLGLITASRPPD